MKLKLYSILLACAGASLARADFNPVQLTPGSYTFDIVVESNTVQAVPYCINVTAGAGSSLGDNTYYEQGMYARIGQPGGNSGIPPHNTIFTNINDASITYLMPPDYTTNNEVMIDSQFTSGTLTLKTATTATSLSILSTSGGGSMPVNYTVNHQDGSTDVGTLSLSDWFGGGSLVAWGANGRMDQNGNYNNFNSGTANNNAPYLYGYNITVSGTSPVTSIDLAYASGGAHANFYAVSASTDGNTYTPVPVSGFNVIGTIAAAFPVTATMDEGTNTSHNGNMNTWFEQGYDTNALTAGLPPSGSIFNSQSQPTHHYQMGNYSTNNAILIDTNHMVANITPVTPASYYAVSLLTAGANIGGTPMQNTCILQHQDGVNETNTFDGYDWFYTGAPGALAYEGNGRVNMSNRTLNNINNGFPYLFESYFIVNDTASPITNIVVMYNKAPGADSTTYVMAVSGSSTGIAPVVTSGPLPATQSWYPTQTATMSVQTSGTAPITNSWWVEHNGVYVPLTDGVDANGSTVSGSTMTTLTISNLKTADGGNYEFRAANATGVATSEVATVVIDGIAGIVPNGAWNNIDNVNFTVGNSTNIVSSNGVTTASLTLNDNGVNNGWNSGITGDGANASLMHGYIDAGANSGLDAIAVIGGLSDSSYDVYLYCFPDQTRPSNGGDGLPNYTINGTTYYAPALGGTGASTFDATKTSVGGVGFTGFIPMTTYTTNDFTNDIPASSFGNYIKISGVTPVGGQITIQAETDSTTYRSPLNGIQIVSTSNDGQNFGINFLGNTTDWINATPLAPDITAQSPTSSFSVLTNHDTLTTFSVTVDSHSATPLFYQWYNGASPILGATNSTYANVDTNSATFSCVVSNFVGSVTSTPVAVTIIAKPASGTYMSAIMAYNPLAYWPLTETSGNIAFDYASTNDGTYNGTFTLGNAGLPVTAGIGANTSAGFDGTTAYVDIPVNNLNVTGAVTVIEWVLPTTTSGFRTSLGHSDQSYRFDVAGTQPHWADPGPDVTDPNGINDGNWHQMIGVYDGTNQYLYVDTTLISSVKASGTPNSTDDVWIGGAPDYAGARNFQGDICQVAIIPQALSAAQIKAIFNTLGTAPTVTVAPTSPSIYEGGSITFAATLGGGAATKLQWYAIDASNNSNNIAGATNATLTLNNVPIANNGYTYGINVSNPYGSATASTMLTVQSAAAFLNGDLSPLSGEAYAGAPVTYTANAGGSLPIYYQWLVDGVPVTGATNVSFTFAAGCGSHQVQVQFTNVLSAGVPTASSSATIQGDSYPTNITFNTDGTGWQLNGGGTFSATITTNVLKLTDGNGGEATSAFWTTPQYVGSFMASFTYVGNGSADGAAFILQNFSTGSAALGGGGGGLGYYGISNSIALEFNLYQIVGIAAGTNGNTYGAGGGAAYQGTGPVNIASAHPINVVVKFDNGVMGVSLTDATTKATFSTNYVYGPISDLLGGSDIAYVGFSGGDGGSSSVQTISNFQFQSVVVPVTISVTHGAGNTAVLSWSAADPNYTLQTSPSLINPTWTTGPTPTQVGENYQVTVGTSTVQQTYYRLVHTTCP